MIAYAHQVTWCPHKVVLLCHFMKMDGCALQLTNPVLLLLVHTRVWFWICQLALNRGCFTETATTLPWLLARHPQMPHFTPVPP